MIKKYQIAAGVVFALCVLVPGLVTIPAAGAPRVINIIADKDNRFKVPGAREPVITMKCNEVAVLRITANRGAEWDDKDGTIHTFTIVALKDKGWDFRLKPGVQQLPVVAPSEAGEYKVECTVKCGAGHDDMRMKLIVTE